MSDNNEVQIISDLNNCLKYDPETGDLIWRVETGRGLAKKYPGDVSGCQMREGYIQIKRLGRKYLAHRVAWLLFTGEWPENEVDHINGVRNDNRWGNLRGATRSENKQNERNRKSASGLRGVSKSRDKWRAVVTANGETHRLGTFESREEAYQVARDARSRLHGEFAREI